MKCHPCPVPCHWGTRWMVRRTVSAKAGLMRSAKAISPASLTPYRSPHHFGSPPVHLRSSQFTPVGPVCAMALPHEPVHALGSACLGSGGGSTLVRKTRPTVSAMRSGYLSGAQVLFPSESTAESTLLCGALRSRRRKNSLLPRPTRHNLELIGIMRFLDCPRVSASFFSTLGRMDIAAAPHSDHSFVSNCCQPSAPHPILARFVAAALRPRSYLPICLQTRSSTWLTSDRRNRQALRRARISLGCLRLAPVFRIGRQVSASSQMPSASVLHIAVQGTLTRLHRPIPTAARGRGGTHCSV